jgi:hypothetical protein
LNLQFPLLPQTNKQTKKKRRKKNREKKTMNAPDRYERFVVPEGTKKSLFFFFFLFNHHFPFLFID